MDVLCLWPSFIRRAYTRVAGVLLIPGIDQHISVWMLEEGTTTSHTGSDHEFEISINLSGSVVTEERGEILDH